MCSLWKTDASGITDATTDRSVTRVRPHQQNNKLNFRRALETSTFLHSCTHPLPADTPPTISMTIFLKTFLCCKSTLTRKSKVGS